MPSEDTQSFVSFRHDGRDRFGLLQGDGAIVDLTTQLPHIESLRAAVAARALAELSSRARSLGADCRAEKVEFLPIIPDPEKIICVGANFPMANRPGASKPKYPVLFARFSNTLTGHDQPLAVPASSPTLDYEGELAVVIGEGGSNIPVARALHHVAGYTCFNDATVREWQGHAHQFTPAKNYPRTAAVGPGLVPAELIDDYRALRIVTELNGVIVQDATAGEMIFSVEEVISYCSSFTVLNPGDIIALGSPDGFGATKDPPIYLKKGDKVEVKIRSIGSLRNTVRSDNSGPSI